MRNIKMESRIDTYLDALIDGENEISTANKAGHIYSDILEFVDSSEGLDIALRYAIIRYPQKQIEKEVSGYNKSLKNRER